MKTAKEKPQQALTLDFNNVVLYFLPQRRKIVKHGFHNLPTDFLTALTVLHVVSP
jgi:hypothetical protein